MDLEILKIASDTTNVKDLSDFTHKGKSKNSICGDEIIIKIKLKNNKIIDIGYEGKSCIYCQASASMISNHIKNNNLKKIIKTINDIRLFYLGKEVILKNKLKKIFNKNNLKRKDCIYLPIKTLINIFKFNSNQ